MRTNTKLFQNNNKRFRFFSTIEITIRYIISIFTIQNKLMKKSLLLLSILLISISNFAQNSDAILGNWVNENGDRIIEIYKNNDLYYGKVLWLKDSEKGKGVDRLDLKNPNQLLEKRNIVGIDFLMIFSYFSERDVWKEGQIYNYETGNTYSGKMSLNDDGELELTGYYGILWFLGRTKTYTRVITK